MAVLHTAQQIDEYVSTDYLYQSPHGFASIRQYYDVLEEECLLWIEFIAAGRKYTRYETRTEIWSEPSIRRIVKKFVSEIAASANA